MSDVGTQSKRVEGQPRCPLLCANADIAKSLGVSGFMSTRPYALRPGGSTTTTAPGFTRFTRSMTSSLVMRMQPDEMA